MTRNIEIVRPRRRKVVGHRQVMPHSASVPETPFPRTGLLALSAAIFISMASEFLPSGLLPQMAVEFDVSLAVVGQLVSVFAAAVIITAAPLAVLSRRVDRKLLAAIALAGIIAANVAVAAAPSFELLVGARVIGGVAHGLFWSVAAAYAADLVPRSQLGRAAALTAAGGSLAGVLGVPVGNALGQAFGWRAAFLAMAVMGALVLAVILVKLPRVPGWSPATAASSSEDDAEASRPSTLPRILVVCVIILLFVIGQTTLGTYMVAWLVEVAGLSATVIPIHLLATGGAALVGVWVIGRVADRFPRRALFIGGVVVVATDILYVVVAPGGLIPVVAVAIVSSMAFAGVPVLLQARMMRVASRSQRTLAAALQTTAFNVGIGGGAVVGGLALEAAGLEALPWIAAMLVVLGMAAVMIADATGHRSSRE